MDSLDFSEKANSGAVSDSESRVDVSALVDQESLGTRGKDGMYVVKDWEFRNTVDESKDFVSRTLKEQQAARDSQSSGMGTLGSIFARLTGSKTLTESDLKPVLEAMKQHLMKKNVAKDIAEKVCEGVGEGLVGKKAQGFQSARVCLLGFCVC